MRKVEVSRAAAKTKMFEGLEKAATNFNNLRREVGQSKTAEQLAGEIKADMGKITLGLRKEVVDGHKKIKGELEQSISGIRKEVADGHQKVKGYLELSISEQMGTITKSFQSVLEKCLSSSLEPLNARMTAMEKNIDAKVEQLSSAALDYHKELQALKQTGTSTPTQSHQECNATEPVMKRLEAIEQSLGEKATVAQETSNVKSLEQRLATIEENVSQLTAERSNTPIESLLDRLDDLEQLIQDVSQRTPEPSNTPIEPLSGRLDDLERLIQTGPSKSRETVPDLAVRLDAIDTALRNNATEAKTYREELNRFYTPLENGARSAPAERGSEGVPPSTPKRRRANTVS